MNNKTIDCLITHSLNNSSSKATHKFSTSERFPKTKQSYCNSSAYDILYSTELLNTGRNKNGKFGREEKFAQFNKDMLRRSLSPAPNTYSTNEKWNSDNKNQKVSTFGTTKKLVLKQTKVPGPGTYNNNYNPQMQLSYTMRNKTKSGISSWNKAGPGQYDPSIEFLSTVQHSNVKMGKEKRFNTRVNTNPACNQYIVEHMMTEPTSKYFDSQKYSFGKGKKEAIDKRMTPGPGTYQKFSQFIDSPLAISARR